MKTDEKQMKPSFSSRQCAETDFNRSPVGNCVITLKSDFQRKAVIKGRGGNKKRQDGINRDEQRWKEFSVNQLALQMAKCAW